MSKVIVVTGTASGLGKATVEKFAAEGWNVVATVRKEADLKVHNENVRTLLLDVDDEEAAPGFAQEALAQFGRVDALVNNAGSYTMGPVEATTMDQAHRQFQTNFFGLIAITRAFLPIFREQRSGVVVNIASIAAEQSSPYHAVYSASKAAVVSLSESLNIEMEEFGVRVRAVLPGQHATAIFTKIDQADAPEDYQVGIKRFFSGVSRRGSAPEVTAEVVLQAVLDPRFAPVRYHSGPDSAAIPRAKQILGQQQYWEEFRAAAGGRPSALWRTLMAAPGEHEFERAV
ncbi:SDR family oxidoreductase [Lentzea sp. NPDC051838]|uniref:SDR family oxidoreductase n=1 Tax=Lentzea sp. NPDC051838 TaxID=3154849 RepID=UPI003422E0F4